MGPIPQMDNLSLQTVKAHSPEGEVMKFQPLTSETSSTAELDVRPVTPTIKANSLEELEGRTDRVETPAMKAHSLESQTLPTKEKKKSKKSKVDIEDSEITKLEKGLKVVKSMYAQLMNEHGPPKDDNKKEVEKEIETDPADSMEVESSL